MLFALQFQTPNNEYLFKDCRAAVLGHAGLHCQRKLKIELKLKECETEKDVSTIRAQPQPSGRLTPD